LLQTYSSRWSDPQPPPRRELQCTASWLLARHKEHNRTRGWTSRRLWKAMPEARYAWTPPEEGERSFFYIKRRRPFSCWPRRVTGPRQRGACRRNGRPAHSVPGGPLAHSDARAAGRAAAGYVPGKGPIMLDCIPSPSRHSPVNPKQRSSTKAHTHTPSRRSRWTSLALTHVFTTHGARAGACKPHCLAHGDPRSGGHSLGAQRHKDGPSYLRAQPWRTATQGWP
jgi:hypothetical protein